MHKDILLITDDAEFGKIAKNHLSWHDFNLDIETDFNKTPERLELNPYMLLFLDFLTLSDSARHCLAFIKKMRGSKNAVCKQIPIVLLCPEPLSETQLQNLYQLNGHYLNRYEGLEMWSERIYSMLEK